MVETVEASGNDAKNPLTEEKIIICSSSISGGYRALLIRFGNAIYGSLNDNTHKL